MVQIHVRQKESRPQRRDPDTGMKYLLVGFKQETTVYNFSPSDYIFVKYYPYIEISIKIMRCVHGVQFVIFKS